MKVELQWHGEVSGAQGGGHLHRGHLLHHVPEGAPQHGKQARACGAVILQDRRMPAAEPGVAFRELLNPGRPAYVDRYAASLEEMIGLVVAAGGVAVLAHPWARADPASLQRDGLAHLQSLGLAGVEVDHQDHAPGDRDRLRALVRELGLVVTGASDFHGEGKTDHDLGCNTTSPDDLDALLAVAEAAGRTSGRMTPQVVRP